MLTRLIAATTAVILTSIAVDPASAIAAERVVVPTGEFPADVVNVQAAVNLGGTILLKARNAAGVPTAFNFGPPVRGSGRVFLNTDVIITGETADGQTSTILGGEGPFRSVRPVRAAISGLDFERPYTAAAIVVVTAGFQFSRCHVARVVPFLAISDPDLGDLYKAQAVLIDLSVIPPTSSTVLAIEDNVFEDCGLGGAQLGYGMFVFPGEARVRIARNVIRGANLAGILLYLPGDESVIEDNSIVPGPGDIDPRFFGDGIHLLGGALDRDQQAPLIVRDNEIRVEGPEAFGIFAFGDDAFNGPIRNTIIGGNRITLAGGFAGIGLLGNASACDVLHNKIGGDGDFSLLLGEVPGDDVFEQPHSNLLVGNNIAQFDARVADVLFDFNTFNNELKGYSGTAIDLGTGNRITGATGE